MSYAVTPVLVDIQNVRDTLGSRDERLIAILVEQAAEAFTFGEEDESGPSQLREAIRCLIMGESLDRLAPDRYRFAFEMICSHLGEVILPDAWGGVRWDALELVGLEDVVSAGPPVPLPDDKLDPRIGFLTAADVEHRLSGIAENPPVSDDEDVLELREEYDGWLREAASRNMGIVFFL
jgi:hypothetical protein